jgi:hypothetical protein
MTLPSPIAIVRQIVQAVPLVLEHLSEETVTAIKAAGYDGINTIMRAAVYDAVYFYLTSGAGHVTNYRNAMSTAVSKAYIEAADLAYVDGGGELPMDTETAAWARLQVDLQFGYIDELFEGLRELRKSGDFDAGAIASARAEGYASGLDGFYNEAVLRGKKNQMVTWHLGATEKHCKTCASLDGKSHRISWYIDHDYIPRKNGCNLDCGGYNCDCTLTDKDGNEVTI